MLNTYKVRDGSCVVLHGGYEKLIHEYTAVLAVVTQHGITVGLVTNSAPDDFYTRLENIIALQKSAITTEHFAGGIAAHLLKHGVDVHDGHIG